MLSNNLNITITWSDFSDCLWSLGITSAADATKTTDFTKTCLVDGFINSTAALGTDAVSIAFAPTYSISNIYFHYDILKISPAALEVVSKKN